MKVLLIEDNREIIEAVSLCLQIRWPSVEIMTSTVGKVGINVLKSQDIDFLFLDNDVSDNRSFSLLQEIRSFSNVPIIILAFKNEEEQIRSLEIGADDYIAKPFQPRELLARFNAVLRRSTSISLMGEDKFYTPKQIASIMGVISFKVRKWIKNGKLNTYHIDNQIRIKESDFRRFVVLNN